MQAALPRPHSCSTQTQAALWEYHGCLADYQEMHHRHLALVCAPGERVRFFTFGVTILLNVRVPFCTIVVLSIAKAPEDQNVHLHAVGTACHPS